MRGMVFMLCQRGCGAGKGSQKSRGDDEGHCVPLTAGHREILSKGQLSGKGAERIE
jgi:hypothetical protein